ncbi:MAG: response regulator [Alphaproteobacteria bacterium]|nr:response regulator [Alphaproteobacteria bacterium]
MTKAALPIRLLVVETDDEARTFLRRRLTRLGYEVTDTADHERALAMVAKTVFDIVLLGLHAAPGDEPGFELLRRIRERRTPAELPVLAVAPETASEDVAEALALGANDCLLRPLYIGVAHARVGMLTGRGSQHDLQSRLDTLDEAADRTEALSAVVSELGHDICAPLNALLGAASALTRVCASPELAPAIQTIDAASAALDLIIVRALGRADRRARTPKPTLQVLLADNDAASRFAVHDLLNAAETPVELTEAATGLEAALATDTAFFDLILINLAAPEAVAGMRAIRRAERENSVRRTPVLAFGARADGVRQAIEAGADLYVREPLTPSALLTTLAEALVREAEDVRAVA